METTTNGQTATTQPAKLAFDDEARAAIAAVRTMTALPDYGGPTVDQLTTAASAAASKAVLDAYRAFMTKAR